MAVCPTSAVPPTQTCSTSLTHAADQCCCLQARGSTGMLCCCLSSLGSSRLTAGKACVLPGTKQWARDHHGGGTLWPACTLRSSMGSEGRS